MTSRSTTTTNARRVGLVLLLVGVFSSFSAVYYVNQILAFLGLGLIFWGVLFLLVLPSRYFEGSLLGSSAIASYVTIDRIVNSMEFTGKSYYIPQRLKGKDDLDKFHYLEDAPVFISAENNINVSSLEELPTSNFVIENPEGILIAPPGLGLYIRLKKEIGPELKEMQLDGLCSTLPRILLEKLRVAEKIEMSFQNTSVYLVIRGSIYQSLFDDKNSLKSISLVGCPITSAIACVLAKATGGIIALENFAFNKAISKLEVTYSLNVGENR